MFFIQLIVFLLIIAGIILLLDLTPSRIAEDIEAISSARKTLRYMVDVAQGKRKISKFQRAIEEIKFSLKLTHRESEFSKICTLSFCLVIVGIIIAMFAKNVLALPIIAGILGMIPYLYIRRIVVDFNKRVKDELETALSVITSSYIRTEDIISAVDENLDNIKQPVKSIFAEFVGQTKLITANTKLALDTLKQKIDNTVFHEWCDIMIQCQDDKTLKDALQSTAEKLTDIRIVNGKLDNMIMNYRKDYYSVLAVMFLNYPALYFLNKDWFKVLTDTTIGKIMVAATFIIAIATTVKMLKVTKPIEYKR